jgi:hypothetical protein
MRGKVLAIRACHPLDVGRTCKGNKRNKRNRKLREHFALDELGKGSLETRIECQTLPHVHRLIYVKNHDTGRDGMIASETL